MEIGVEWTTIVACLSGVLGLSAVLTWAAYRIGQSMVQGTRQVTKTLTSPLPGRVRHSLREARYYGHQIITMGNKMKAERTYVTSTVESVRGLLGNLDQLEENLLTLYSRRNLNHEIGRTEHELERLRADLRRATEHEAGLLRNLIESKEHHRSILHNLRTFRNQVELAIQQNAAMLNSTHAEITLLTTKSDADHRRFQRLNIELRENASGISDLLEVVDEMSDDAVLHSHSRA